MRGLRIGSLAGSETRIDHSSFIIGALLENIITRSVVTWIERHSVVTWIEPMQFAGARPPQRIRAR